MSEVRETRARDIESPAQPADPTAPASNLTRVLVLPIVVFLLVPIVLSLIVKYLFDL